MRDVYSGSMSEEPTSERQAHLRDYWRTIWVGRWTIVSVFGVVLAVGIAATIFQTRIFRATATLQISPRMQRVVRVDDVSEIGAAGRGWSAEDRYFKTQLEVLKSRAVAQRAFDKLGLKDHPLFRTARDPVARFMSKIEVEPVPDTLMVTLSIEGPDPNDVASWVNAVADGYVNRNIEQANQATHAAIRSLLDQLEPLRENLVKREHEKFEYARKNGVYMPETQKTSYKERIASLEKDFTATKLKRLELDAVFQRIEGIEKERGDYFVIPQVANDQVLRGLVKEKGELESEARKLLVTLKPGHFKVRETQAALEKVTQRIKAETERIISAIRTEYSLARAREKNLKSEILRTQKEALASSERGSTYEILSTESQEAKRVYDLVAQRVKEVDLNASLLRNNLTILERAILSTTPVRPRPLINLAVSVLMGLGLGVGTVFFLEYLDNTIRSADQLDREFGLRALAIVPRRRPEAEAAVSEAFSALRTGVQFSSMNRARRVLLVTSAGPQEGKTLTALMLARAMARAGEKVCLIDCDLRRPVLHEQFNTRAEPGLTNYLSIGGGAPAITGIIRDNGAGEPALIASGPLPASPAELFASERFVELIKKLKADHDWVVIDSPPAAGLTDSVLLAAQSDMVIIVTRQGRTDRDVLRRALDVVRTANPNIIGAVLNDVDLRRSENRGLYYSRDGRVARKPVGAARPDRRPAAL
ncbi:MAG: GumC family protein [Acidobacteriota bacterium]